jgi:hypothetical protein
MHAVLKPLSARPNAARRPAPPAPLQTTVSCTTRGDAARTHTTMASYSCSMSGYLPDVKDCSLKSQHEEGATPDDPATDVDFLRLDRVGPDYATRGGGRVEAAGRLAERAPKGLAKHGRRERELGELEVSGGNK